jgi:hypothetical protein
MLWKELNFHNIQLEPGKNQRQKISYDGKPLRFQVPESLCTDGLSEYDQITIETTPEFAEWFSRIEKRIGTHEPWKSIMTESYMTLKLDASTQVFDSKRQLDTSIRSLGTFQGCMIKCIVEIVGLYYFRETYGLTCRVYQIISRETGCLFESTPAPSGGGDGEHPCWSVPCDAGGGCAPVEDR